MNKPNLETFITNEPTEVDIGYTIELGIFIDGTYNNLNNALARIENEKMQRRGPYNADLQSKNIPGASSFASAPSNVAKMYPFYEDSKNGNAVKTKVYVEGIGTENFQEDNFFGGAVGTGETGVIEKAKKALRLSVEKIKEKGVAKINKLTIDAFGFSRGAAAARHLVHEVTKSGVSTHVSKKDGVTTTSTSVQYGYLGNLLEENGIPINLLEVRFVGIYDTVSSYGMLSFSNDVEQLGLDSVRNAKFTLHLTAADEHRQNFSLTTINSAISVGRGKEFSIPGSHGDLGGVYNYGDNEVRVFFASEKEYLVEEGWYKEDQIVNGEFSPSDGFKIICSRYNISNEYGHIPLHIMSEFVKEKRLPINSDAVKSSYPIPNSLSVVKRQIYDYVFNNREPFEFHTKLELSRMQSSYGYQYFRRKLDNHAQIKRLRNEFLHFSAISEGLKDAIAFGPRRDFFGNRYRKIIDG